MFLLKVSLEHTFKEFGIDGILSLQGYWNKKIRQVAFKLEQESRDLLNEYNSQKVVLFYIPILIINLIINFFKIRCYRWQQDTFQLDEYKTIF